MDHPLMKSFRFYDNPYRSLYGSNAEFELTKPGIELGSLCHLSHIENPTLTQLSKAYGENTATELMLLHVSALNMSSGACNRMDAPAMLLCCKDIISVFGYITIAEFCVFCARMRTLRYVRKRSDYVFSADTILQGLHEFMDDLKVARKRFDGQLNAQSDSREYISHDQAKLTDEYRQALKAEQQRMLNEGVAPASRPSDVMIKRVRPVRLSDAEFSERKKNMIEMMKRQYDISE